MKNIKAVLIKIGEQIHKYEKKKLRKPTKTICKCGERKGKHYGTCSKDLNP